MNINQTNNNMDPKNMMNFFPGMSKTKPSLKFLISFLFGIAPLIIELLITSPNYIPEANHIIRLSATWLWLLGFFTFLISGILVVIIVKFSNDINQDVVAQTLAFSFSCMFILGTPALEWWETTLIFFASVLIMSIFFQILVFSFVGILMYRKIKKSSKDLQNGNFDFSKLDPNISNLFVNNPEAMEQMKNYMNKHKSSSSKKENKKENKKDLKNTNNNDDKDDDIIDV